MPLTATGEWDVEVGRIRANDVFGDYGLDLFVCGDQVIMTQDSHYEFLILYNYNIYVVIAWSRFERRYHRRENAA